VSEQELAEIGPTRCAGARRRCGRAFRDRLKQRLRIARRPHVGLLRFPTGLNSRSICCRIGWASNLVQAQVSCWKWLARNGAAPCRRSRRGVGGSFDRHLLAGVRRDRGALGSALVAMPARRGCCLLRGSTRAIHTRLVRAPCFGARTHRRCVLGRRMTAGRGDTMAVRFTTPAQSRGYYHHHPIAAIFSGQHVGGSSRFDAAPFRPRQPRGLVGSDVAAPARCYFTADRGEGADGAPIRRCKF